jgi:mannose-6-phosphate isomerase-like protein (cupin superfamily)
VVLSGRVRVGDVECEAGTIFLIPANQHYALEVIGDEPLTFVVVRPGVAEYAGS